METGGETKCQARVAKVQRRVDIDRGLDIVQDAISGANEQVEQACKIWTNQASSGYVSKFWNKQAYSEASKQDQELGSKQGNRLIEQETRLIEQGQRLIEQGKRLIEQGKRLVEQGKRSSSKEKVRRARNQLVEQRKVHRARRNTRRAR